MDPLLVLRDFIKNGKKAVLEGDFLVFDNIAFPRKSPTAWKAEKGKGNNFALDALWFIHLNNDKKRSDYVTQCTNTGTAIVPLGEKKEIIDYLNGTIETSASLGQAPTVTYEIREKKQDDEEIVPSKKLKSEEPVVQDAELDEKTKQEKLLNAERLEKAKSRIQAMETDTTSSLAAEVEEDKTEVKRKRKPTKASTTDDVPAKMKYVEVDMGPTKEILKRERVLHNRTNFLQIPPLPNSTQKDFSNLLAIAKKIHHQDKLQSKKKDPSQKHKDSSSSKPSASSYDRYHQFNEGQEGKFWNQRLGGADPAEFNIDTKGSFGDFVSSNAESEPKKPSSSSKPKPSVSSAEKKKEVKTKFVVPIIIVCPGKSDLINMYNIKEFLQDGSFVAAAEKISSGEKKPSEVVVERKRNNHSLIYKVVDSTASFSDQDWKRVVAVFASGANWQFKDWTWATPVEVFSHVKGFHVKYDDEPVPENIKAWAVKVLNVSKLKGKGHIGVTAGTQFWDAVDKHLLLSKSSKDLFHSHYYI